MKLNLPTPHPGQILTFLLRSRGVICPSKGPLPGAQVLLRAHGGSLGLSALELLELSARISPPSQTLTIDLPDEVLLPGLVNAHTHLDLTHVGPRPRPQVGCFADWLDAVRVARPQGEEQIAAAVRAGIDLSLRGGVVALGDIAGCPRSGPTRTPGDTLRGGPLAAVSCIEFFAVGHEAMNNVERALDVLESLSSCAQHSAVRAALSPHAPYTVCPEAYARVAEYSATSHTLMVTHLAETLDERRFVADGSGPHYELLVRLGLLDDAMRAHIGRGTHPIDLLLPRMRSGRWLAVHVNDCTSAHVHALAGAGISVAYCPRAAAYFGVEREVGTHRYRDMLRSGVNVCLGTDSVINLPIGSDHPHLGRISPLDEGRLLVRRDNCDGRTALSMMTTHGARALGMRPEAFVWAGGPMAGIAAVQAENTTFDAVFRDDGNVRTLAVCGGAAW